MSLARTAGEGGTVRRADGGVRERPPGSREKVGSGARRRSLPVGEGMALFRRLQVD